jgi:hypothetical protein
VVVIYKVKLILLLDILIFGLIIGCTGKTYALRYKIKLLNEQLENKSSSIPLNRIFSPSLTLSSV